MENETPVTSRFVNWFCSSITIKIITVSILTLLLLIPAAMITSVISERKMRQEAVNTEINSKWGLSQMISGPVLTINYLEYYQLDNKKTSSITKTANFLPKNLAFDGTILPEIRYRGIYKAVQYTAAVNITGAFDFPDFSKLGILPENILWNESYLSIGVSDMRGLRDSIPISWNKTVFETEPGVQKTGLFTDGINTNLKEGGSWKKGESRQFSLKINLNGSSEITFLPLGKTTTAQLKSSWSSPSFCGSYLPVERTVSADGFNAKWKVLNLNRNIPQQWIGETTLDKSTTSDYTARYRTGVTPIAPMASFGTQLILPVDHYQKVERTVKYAVLFISLTFLTFLMIEIIKKTRVHPIQYLLVGTGITLFYLLLLSLSEQFSFGHSYILSSFAVIMLIAGYSYAVLHSKVLATIVSSLLAILYSYLYILLQLEDYALLMGSAGLFVILGLVMFLTRKIDWYDISAKKQTLC